MQTKTEWGDATIVNIGLKCFLLLVTDNDRTAKLHSNTVTTFKFMEKRDKLNETSATVSEITQEI